VVLLRGEAERAAVLLGAGTALRGLSIAGAPDDARVAREATDRIGPAAYAAGFARGAALTHAEAFALIRAAAG
jgi:hypothetical protein